MTLYQTTCRWCGREFGEAKRLTEEQAVAHLRICPGVRDEEREALILTERATHAAARESDRKIRELSRARK
jgi:hypothetical protein